MRTRRRILAIVGAVCIAVTAVIVLFSAHSQRADSLDTGQSPATSGSRTPGVGSPADSAAAVASPTRDGEHADGRQADAAEAAVDEMVDNIADDVLKSVRPVQWHRKEFDGRAENFSPEDLEKAKAITGRYFGNFLKIQTLAFTVTRKRESLTSNEFTKWFFEPQRSKRHDYSMEVQMTRSPMYLKMEGTFGNGEAFREIVTPAGEISSGHFGQGASWIPHWLDGERLFLEEVVLKYGNSVRQDVPMDHELPAEVGKHVDLTGYKNNRYDVVELVQEDVQTVRSLWFNRETGMLDFSISTRMNAKKGENPFFDFCAVTYNQVDGVYYPVRSIGLDNDCTTKEELRMSNLEINGES